MPTADKRDAKIKQLESQVKQLREQIVDQGDVLSGSYSEMSTVKSQTAAGESSLTYNSPTVGGVTTFKGGPPAKWKLGQQVKVWFVPLES